MAMAGDESVLRDGDAGGRAGGERVLIVGATSLTRAIVQELGRDPARAIIVGIVPDGEPAAGVRGPWLGPLERLDKIIRETRPSRIIVDVGGSAEPQRGGSPEATAARGERNRWQSREVVVAPLVDALAADVVVEDAVDTYERLTGKAALDALRPGHVIFSKAFEAGRAHAAFARGLSVLAAVGGLVVFAPLFLILAVAIKLDSAGSVFFVQPRLGRGGRPFRLLKFRTMRPGAPRSEWVRDNGDRITRVGAWLRRFRLDELPQLVNVLRGEMDLVGPRPHPASNAALFNAGIPFYPLRLLMRPGVTGWAQVQYGYANGLEEETEKMRYDLYYIKHRSVALDLRILVLTLKVVLFGSGVEKAQVPGDRANWEAAA